jgi:translation initiation factor IF-2
MVQTDASGTLEAVKSALSVLPQELVILRFLFAAPSQITISDIDLATASSAMILGFNTEPSDEVQAAAKEKGMCLYHSHHVDPPAFDSCTFQRLKHHVVSFYCS